MGKVSPQSELELQPFSNPLSLCVPPSCLQDSECSRYDEAELSVIGESDLQDIIVPVEHREQLVDVFKLFPDVCTHAPGRTLVVKQENTGMEKPATSRPYRASPDKQAYIKENIQEMLSDGIVEPSQSPWSIQVVPKKSGTNRFCVEYR